MPENVGDFQWTPKRLKAAALLATGEYVLKQVARKLGLNIRTLDRWKAEPEFKAKVQEFAAEVADLTERFAVASRVRRVKNLDGRVNRLKRIMAERAADDDMADVPGGKTGLLVRRIKSIGSGENAQVVNEYEVDAALLRELREHEKQAAIELGQWTEKREHRIPDIDDLIAAELARLAGAGQGAVASAPPANSDPPAAGAGQA